MDRLAGLHRAVRAAVLGCARGSTGLTNARGDTVKVFDLVDNDAALAFLESLRVPFLVESEEVEAPIKAGTASPALTDRIALIAAASESLCEEIVERVNDGHG